MGPGTRSPEGRSGCVARHERVPQTPARRRRSLPPLLGSSPARGARHPALRRLRDLRALSEGRLPPLRVARPPPDARVRPRHRAHVHREPLRRRTGVRERDAVRDRARRARGAARASADLEPARVPADRGPGRHAGRGDLRGGDARGDAAAVQAARELTRDQSGSISTRSTPRSTKPSARAAPSETSISRRRRNGPRSVIVTTTDRPLRRLVTRTTLPMGRVRCAPVIASGSKRAPLAVRRRPNSAPYHEASPIADRSAVPMRPLPSARAGLACTTRAPFPLPSTRRAGGLPRRPDATRYASWAPCTSAKLADGFGPKERGPSGETSGFTPRTSASSAPRFRGLGVRYVRGLFAGSGWGCQTLV